jgi:hypothetical protein
VLAGGRRGTTIPSVGRAFAAREEKDAMESGTRHARHRSRARACLASACVAALLGCATGDARQPVSAAPKRSDGEALRGPLAGAEVVEAQPEPVPTGREKLDFNDDGHIDREEFRNFFARAFHSVDGDDDRVLRGAELARLPPDVVPRADRDGSGSLDVDEYVGLALAWFTRCDANHDDVLGPDEEQACSQAAAPKP